MAARPSLFDRLWKLFRNDPPAIMLLLANLAPLIDLIVKDEPVGSLLIIYWLQMLIIGFWTCIKIMVIARLAALLYVPMFVVIYVAVVNIFGVIAGGLLDDQMRGTDWAASFSLWNYWLPALLFFVSHGTSFYLNFLGRHEDKSTSAEAPALQAFARAMPMWVAAILGGFIGGFFKSAAFVVLFVLPMKVLLDLIGHFAEHDMLKGPYDSIDPFRT